MTPTVALIHDLEDRLKAERTSVAHVCRAAGIDRVTWQRWKGGAPPRAETWRRVRAVLVPILGADVPEQPPAVEESA